MFSQVCVSQFVTISVFHTAPELLQVICVQSHLSFKNAAINWIFPCISLYYHYLSPQLRAYNRPTRLSPSWPDSSTGRAQHRHCRRQGSNPRSGLSCCFCLSSAKIRRSNSFMFLRWVQHSIVQVDPTHLWRSS